MTAVDLAGGLATYLGEAWGCDVVVSAVATTTAGARRRNVVFEADAGGERHRLVATIVPAGETMLNSIDAEAGVRALAEQHGVPVPHVHVQRTDGDLVGGPVMISDFVAGETVPRKVLRLVGEHGIGDLVARQLGEALGRLHAHRSRRGHCAAADVDGHRWAPGGGLADRARCRTRRPAATTAGVAARAAVARASCSASAAAQHDRPQ